MSEPVSFTPGPWQQGDGDPRNGPPGDGRIHGGNAEWLFCLEDYGNGSRDDARCEADARLILAAPALYEALEFLCFTPVDPNITQQERVARGRAALALARGES